MSFTTFSAEVKRFFQPVVNTLHARYNFHSQKQQEGETVAEFLGALRALLVDCQIPSVEEQRRVLAHQLVLRCCSRETLQKLLVIGGPILTLSIL